MPVQPALTQLEEFVLLSVLRLGGEGYGVSIRKDIEAQTHRPVSIASIYAALERLEARGMVQVRLSAPLPERGGRARKHIRMLPAGNEALAETREVRRHMWDGVSLRPHGTR